MHTCLGFEGEVTFSAVRLKDLVTGWSELGCCFETEAL